MQDMRTIVWTIAAHLTALRYRNINHKMRFIIAVLHNMTVKPDILRNN